MRIDASLREEASSSRARHSGKLISIVFALIAVSLACKAVQGDQATAVDTPTAIASQYATVDPGMLATRTAAAPGGAPVIPALPKTSPTVPISSPTATPLIPPLPTGTATPPPVPTASVASTLPLQVTASQAAPALDPQVEKRQAAIFEEIWGVIRDRYLYPDFNGLDWNAVGEEYRQRIRNGISDDEFYKTIHEMIERLGDEHSTYFSPQEAADMDQLFEGQATYVGIGVITAPAPERQRLTVLLVFPGSPAEAAGLQVHDAILAANGQPVMDANGMRTNLLRGPEGSTITVTVQTPGQAERVVSITRRAVNQQMPVPRQAAQSPAGKRIGYIYIPTFNETHIDEAVGEALSELGRAAPLDGLILDNRYNGGGASDVLLNTISYFVDGQIGSFIENRNEIPLQVRGQDLLGSQEVPLVVLVGPGTASFGEVFSGALHDLGRAHLIGVQTDGNVEVLSIFNFSDGSRAWIATSTFRPLNHPTQDWEDTGIIPDQSIPTAWDQVTFATDPAILAALQYFDAPPR